MAQTTSKTVHTRIGSKRGLCGSSSNVVAFPDFFGHTDDEVCGRCLELIRRKGYNIQRERARYKANHSADQPAGAGKAIPPTAPTGGHDARI